MADSEAERAIPLDPSRSAEFWSSLPAITDPDVRAFFERLRPELPTACDIPDVESASTGSGSAAMPRSAPEAAARYFPHDRWGHLQVREMLGRGTFGGVFRALDTKLDREVALKLTPALDPSSGTLTRIFHEARELARVRHPNVLLVHGVDVHNGWVGMWTEFIRGVTLEQALKQSGSFDAEECIAVGLELCRAVAAVHEAGLVHGDIKCDNVMRECGGRIVLVDFGLTEHRSLGGETKDTRGTPLYMAPERFRGAPASVASDVYSIGVVLYRLLSCRYPVMANSVAALVAAHLQREREPLPPDVVAVCPALARIIEQTLAEDPSNRCVPVETLHEAMDAAALELRARRSSEPGTRACVRNLPNWLSGFVGREEELEQLTKDLERAPLVTITGAGGAGKSRLAHRGVQRAVERARRGGARALDLVCWVSLAPVSTDEGVPRALTDALGVPETPGKPALDGWVDWIGDRRALLVLDNCDHVLDGVVDLVNPLLASCPNLKLVATSREKLGLPGERVCRLNPMSLPETPPADTVWTRESLARLARVESVRLFVECAQNVDARFTLDASQASEVATICRRLDGIPLAIELVAAAVRSNTVRQILDRLENRLPTLAAPVRGVLPHHRTMTAVVEWSHSRLDPHERTLFRRLACFSGGWTLDTAVAICSEDARDTLGTLDLLSRLIDKSLVEVELRDRLDSGAIRYRMLEPIREYARRELERSGELEPIEAAHRRCFTEEAAVAADALHGPEQRRALGWFTADHDNLRAALRSNEFARGEIGNAVRLAIALCGFWRMRGHWTEAREVCSRLLEDPRVLASNPKRARLSREAAYFTQRLGDFDRARSLYEASLDIAREAGDAAGIASARLGLGLIAWRRGDPESAVRLYTDALEQSRQIGDERGVASALTELAALRGSTGDVDRARSLYEEALAVHQRRDDRAAAALVLCSLGGLAIDRSENERARELLVEGLRVCRELDAPDPLGIALVGLGIVFRTLGEHDAARSHIGEALELARALGDRRRWAYCLAQLGEASRAEGDLPRARRLLGDAAGEFERLRLPNETAMVQSSLSVVVEALGDLASAEQLQHRSIRLFWSAGNRPWVASSLRFLASFAERGGRPRESACWLGALEAMRETDAIRLSEEEEFEARETQERVEAALGLTDARRAYEEGRLAGPSELIARLSAVEEGAGDGDLSEGPA